MKINLGIGFVTGRKSFKSLVKTYIESLNESQISCEKVNVNLFVNFDLGYTKTNINDYIITDKNVLDIVNSICYIDKYKISEEINYLTEHNIVTLDEANLIFGEGYAMKRNTILYFAIKYKMDCLIFIDDDEYPVAPIEINNELVWKGQDILSAHINSIKNSNITYGYQCGYISPIPVIKFTSSFTENDFKIFIKSISNDIINWNSIKEKMINGGITYADPKVINKNSTENVKAINGMKFISGSNLCFNLKELDKLYPFYNPPGARGEDTFMSTCLSKCTVKKVPYYTFHDGFSKYQHILKGILPNKLHAVIPNTDSIATRFLLASIGWIRYKPLLLYITNRENYQITIDIIRKNLYEVVPKICHYFKDKRFLNILSELNLYASNVKKHYEDFQKTKSAWIKVKNFASKFQ
ncbi:hypothetical protein D4Z93_10295 [Clostridium fermenticellae]|uniref:Glycosyltransferase family 2 protein n=1 Tax=Clostridium fermenticellae TaxID=2068654 RepID=A0A386H564_9CLOT|nr:hypothetical protein [Clostridium fermenticellae]AYD40891.1 hypothetical protein D4Z93_10295 [Clostridium fermenticellae]